MVNVANFMLCIFYHNEITEKKKRHTARFTKASPITKSILGKLHLALG